jgi:lipoprotein-releasing system permease protein
LRIGSFIAKRLNRQRGKDFSGLVIKLSFFATLLSVAIMILTLAFVAGFQQAIADKVFSFWGHIRVQQHPSYSAGLSDEMPSIAADSVYQVLKKSQNVVSVDPYVTKAALLRSKSNMEGLMLKGVDHNFSYKRMKPFMERGGWLSHDSTQSSIVISSYTAKVLEVDTGQKLFLYFMNQDGGAPRIRSVRVNGIYKTAIEEYDRSFAITNMGLVQKLLNWDSSSISGYEITINNANEDKHVQEAFMEQLPVDWYANALRDIYPNIFDWLQLQNVNRTLIITIMCIVAVINLISCLLILVLERRKMIGLLKSIGASDFQVQEIFWRQAAFIALKGIVWGNIIGIGLCVLQQTTGFITLDESAYYIKVAPVKIIPIQIILVNIGTILICFLVLLIPSFLVRKIRPVQALRFS